VFAVKSEVLHSTTVERNAQQVADSARALESAGGDAPDIRVLLDAVDRLQHTLELIARQLPAEPARPPSPAKREFIFVPDFEYDYEFWRDADDEGICGRRPAQ